MSTTSRGASARPRATIRDVAALAGVGIKTVSRVINDETNVSAQTRERVERAILALSFKPNLGAGVLRRGDGKTMTIGLLVDAVDNPFSAAINRAVEAVASQHNTAVFAASGDDDPQRERTIIDAFTRRRVDGLILTTIGNDHGYLQVEREQGTPIVFVDRPPVGLLADAVLTDNYDAARKATTHLLTRGHRRLAHLSDDLAISTARERTRGFIDAIAAAGLEPDEVPQIAGLRSVEDAYAAVNALLDRDPQPTGIFTSQNLVTIGAIRALHHRGRQHDIALVGFDDIPLADVIEPAITVMAQDPTRIGTVAAERLFARLSGLESFETTITIPARLIARGSGEIAPPT